ncbi:hypothetical protein AAFX91_17785 [Bradyrhizobium sp. 31Argb]|uniref:hypothetical protein n=1 Tax=Bradyrhizobium sp. 31Argb TaxID=3141247 RepID=UPI0037482692
MTWVRRIFLVVLLLPSLVVAGFAIHAWFGGCIVIDLKWEGCGSKAAGLFLVSVALHFLTVPLMLTWLIVAAFDLIVLLVARRRNTAIDNRA